MVNLIGFIGRHKEYFILSLVILISVALFPLNDNRQIRQLRTYSVALFGTLSKPASYFTETITMREENSRLREENVILADKVYQFRDAYLENIRLRNMLQFQERSTYDLLPARIVGKSFEPMRNTITINVGVSDGVRELMPIISAAGLVGKVILVGENYSIGRILFNRDFRTSGRIERSRVDGIVQWDGTEELVLHNVAKTQDVVEGDVVVTSEYSNIFPPGIRIGVVSSAANIPGSLLRNIRVTPGIDFSRLEEVFVMLYLADQEKLDLETRVTR